MPRNLVRLLALLATAVFLLGACGDDDGGASTTTTEVPGAIDDDTDDGDDTTTTAGDDDTTTTVVTGSGSRDLPDLAAIGSFCGLFEAFEEVDNDDSFFSDDPDLSPEESAAEMAVAFQFLNALFVRSAQLAPGEIKADMELMASGMGQYMSLLAEYDYDFMALTMAAMEDPELEERMSLMESPEFDAAADRVETFVLAECGVDLS